MALHRAEQIMAEVLTQLLASVTATSDIERARLDPWGSSNTTFDGISIYMGTDEPSDFGDWVSMDRNLSVIIEVAVKNSTPEPRINELRKQITIALKNLNIESSLNFVHQVIEGGWSRPVLEPEQEYPALVCEGEYIVKYRRSTTDPSA